MTLHNVPNLRTMRVCKGGQISEVGAKFPREFGPPGAIFPRKFGPGGPNFRGGQISCDTGKKIEEFECPCCRTLFSLKEHEEVANMRGSHFIRNMVDVLNAERTTNIWKCSNHSEKASCSRCVSCEVFLCEECLKVHENWSTFKGHVVLTIEELKKPENQSKISGAMRCKEHTTKKLKFYCESCQVLICRYTACTIYVVFNVKVTSDSAVRGHSPNT